MNNSFVELLPIKGKIQMPKAIIKRPRRILKRKHRRLEDREESHNGTDVPGLVHLQQRIGNRAVQRMLLQREEKEEEEENTKQKGEEEEKSTKPSDLDEEPEPIPEKTGERVKVPSGVAWAAKFPISQEDSDFDSDMRSRWKRFTRVLEDGGANVEIIASKTPPERAYLMHWAWRIAKGEIDPRDVPDADPEEQNMEDEVDIQWWHGDLKAAQSAAQEMVDAFKIDELKVPPPLPSEENLYTEGKAVVALIDWRRELVLYRDKPSEMMITDEPRDATNEALIAIAEAFDLIHLYSDPDTHEVHWGSDEMEIER